MTNPLDEQQAAHVRCLQDFAAAYDAESENGRALRAALAALTAPPLCAKGDFQTQVALMVGADEEDQADILLHLHAWLRLAKGTPAQPRREVTDAEAEKFRRMLPLGACGYVSTEQMRTILDSFALESFANGGDGNGR